MTLAAERQSTVPAPRPQAGCPSRRASGTTSQRTSSPRGSGADRPVVAEGVQLLGEYAGTGYVEAQHLARRPGGQLVQLSPLLHLVAEASDGRSSMEDIASRVGEQYGRDVTADNVRTLIEDKLRPLGVLAGADGQSPDVAESDPMLGLKLRRQVLPPRAVGVVARLARPLFWPPVVTATVLGLIAFDVWLFLVHGIGQGLRSTVEQPAVFLLVAAIVVVATALHELGHAAACSYGGARPGGMGMGVYVVWPAFYTDVTEAYRLDRRGRLRTDLGGVLVNAMVVLAVGGAYALTRYEPLILVCFLLQVQVLQQLLPFLRLDGYYVLSDLVGVPDLFRRIGPVLRSALPGRAREPEVEQLKPWVRRVVTGWVLVLVPLLLLNVAYILLSAPRIVATGLDSASRFVGQLGDGGVTTAFAALQLVLLALPAVGISWTLSRAARRASGGAWRWSSGSAPRRLGVVSGFGVVLTLLAVSWWPDARLTPYREGEPGTVQQHVRELSVAGSGVPLLRAPQEAQERLPAVDPAVARRGDAPGTVPAPTLSPSAERDGPTTDPGSTQVADPTPGPTAQAAEPSPDPGLEPTAGPTAEPTTDPAVVVTPSGEVAPEAGATDVPAGTTPDGTATTDPSATPSP